jgi:predicted ATP-binding protein involved in virulence
MPISITTIHFHNFKAFNEYALHLDEVNILVGPNNSGKSTIIGAVRALESGIKIARVRAPTRIFAGETACIGHRLPEASLPISLENVHTNYNAKASKVSFRLSNGNLLELIFPSDGGCILYPSHCALSREA